MDLSYAGACFDRCVRILTQIGPRLIWRPVRLLLLTLFLSTSIAAQTSVSKVWVADNRDGTYRNPILHADYSDPDVHSGWRRLLSRRVKLQRCPRLTHSALT